jgi:hypothetical protein
MGTWPPSHMYYAIHPSLHDPPVRPKEYTLHIWAFRDTGINSSNTLLSDLNLLHILRNTLDSEEDSSFRHFGFGWEPDGSEHLMVRR